MIAYYRFLPTLAKCSPRNRQQSRLIAWATARRQTFPHRNRPFGFRLRLNQFRTAFNPDIEVARQLGPKIFRPQLVLAQKFPLRRLERESTRCCKRGCLNNGGPPSSAGAVARRHGSRRHRVSTHAVWKIVPRCFQWNWPSRSAGFQTCCVADFQIGSTGFTVRPAGWEARDTADLAVCATGPDRVDHGSTHRKRRGTTFFQFAVRKAIG